MSSTTTTSTEHTCDHSTAAAETMLHGSTPASTASTACESCRLTLASANAEKEVHAASPYKRSFIGQHEWKRAMANYRKAHLALISHHISSLPEQQPPSCSTKIRFALPPRSRWDAQNRDSECFRRESLCYAPGKWATEGELWNTSDPYAEEPELDVWSREELSDDEGIQTDDKEMSDGEMDEKGRDDVGVSREEVGERQRKCGSYCRDHGIDGWVNEKDLWDGE